MSDIRLRTIRAARAIQQWISDQTSLLCLVISPAGPDDGPVVFAVDSVVAALDPGTNRLVLRSEFNSFVDLQAWSEADFIAVHESGGGTMVELHFHEDSVVCIADHDCTEHLEQLLTVPDALEGLAAVC